MFDFELKTLVVFGNFVDPKISVFLFYFILLLYYIILLYYFINFYCFFLFKVE